MRYIVQTVVLALLVSAARAEDQPQAIRLGPFLRTEVVNGVDVIVPYRATVNQVAALDKIQIDVTIVSDLDDVAAKTDRILAIPLPRDNCRSYSGNNPVVSLDRSSLSYQSGQALLALGGTVVLWACIENPVHKTKVDMQIKDIGFGIKTKVPVVVDMGPGDPIKTIIGSQPFDASLPINLTTDGEQAIQLELGSPTINLEGQYASISNGVLSLAGIDINAKAADALRHAIDPDGLRRRLPSVAGLDLKLSGAQFVQIDEHLGAQIKFSAAVSEANGLRLFQALLASFQEGLPN
ncbi:hypothetical protein ACFX5Q_23465 [Mesorhizobium sp. IMUNJ 23033]|uniref:hypothetical protein n=1 Tax=Mesorhizobium sp. IMUNJ 23033 TaxID=3378039 RepID=UPI00384FE0AE